MRSIALILVFAFLLPGICFGQRSVVFWQEGFAPVDTAAPSRAALSVPGAVFADANQLASALDDKNTRLLVLPYGSAFPEESWPAIYRYLDNGGNLLVLGGRPFTRAAYAEGGWKLRPERNAYARQLYINDYTETPGSAGLDVVMNPDLPGLDLPKVSWERAWSITVKLSQEDLYARQGSAGVISTRLDPLLWGIRGGHKMAAPAVQLDHLKGKFAGGRWILLTASASNGWDAKLVQELAARAAEGAEDFAATPPSALLLPGEPIGLDVRWQRFAGTPGQAEVEFEVAAEGSAPTRSRQALTAQAFPAYEHVVLPAPTSKGLHTITARLLVGGKERAIYRTGFWIRDEQFLRSGPAVTVDGTWFRVDGKAMPVVGTTYMASDVQRQFLMQPNAYVWDRDFAQMRASGINMVRTGLWSAWDQVMKEPGVVQETPLRNLEAWLMTARKYGIPVQFNLFAFIPEVFGGENPYLDPEALRRQQGYVRTIASRFKDVPWLMWDLINEPSFDNPKRLWSTRPNGDAYEAAEWERWLASHYANDGAAASAWNSVATAGVRRLPREEDFAGGSAYRGGEPLRAHDFGIFAQEQFARWAGQLREAIRSTGSKQLVTVGQDEGGEQDRPNPAFFAGSVDFTTQHSWWLNDALLWDSLTAKQPGKAMLVQETGLQNDFYPDATWRRTPEQRAALLERKLAIALATSAGGIEWLWNINSYMTEDQEVTIGIIRPDGTETSEAAVMREMAAFATKMAPMATDAEEPPVAIVTSQALQYSPYGALAIAAQQKAVRTLNYSLHQPAAVVAENQLAQLGQRKLVIVPAPQLMADTTWAKLLQYAEGGGTLLITGSMERDPNWVRTDRLRALGHAAKPVALNFRQAELRIGTQAVPLAFPEQAWVDVLDLGDGSSWMEIPTGKGKLLICAYPVEWSEGTDATAAVYAAALQRARVTAPFAMAPNPGLLVRPTYFKDYILYLFASETNRDQSVDVQDAVTGTRFHVNIPAQRARLVLLERKGGRVSATTESE